MMLYQLSSRDEVHRYKKSIVVHFKGPRRALSTAHHNGGYQEHLRDVFNHDANPGAGMACVMRGNTVNEHMLSIVEEIGLDPKCTAGISTAASMNNVAIKTEVFEDLTVTAIVTGGVEVNGGRVGDYANYHERRGKTVPVKEGTINILLYIDAVLPPETLARAMVTCTEAKTAALQELMVGSNYSNGLATGSGTDGTIVFCNMEAENELVYAGKHSKLGELIGKTVKPAVKEALYLQTGLSAKSQFSFMRRLKRYGVTVDGIWNLYQHAQDQQLDSCLLKAKFIHELEMLESEKYLVVQTSLLVHLFDQLEWGLIEDDDLLSEGSAMLQRLKCHFDLQSIDNESLAEIAVISEKEPIHQLVNDFGRLISAVVGGRIHD